MLLGFDTSIAPQRSQLTKLRASFDFCGCYLAPAPSHPDRTWMTRGIADAREEGFKFLPIYVGQQVVGPGSHKDSKIQGIKDGAEAGTLMREADFAPGSPVYLDLENGAPFPPAEGAYAFAWIANVRALGFTPGIYCSHVLASHFDRATTRVWAFHVPTTAVTIQSKLPPPAPVSLDPYDALQYRQNVMLEGLGFTVDFNAATPHALAR